MQKVKYHFGSQKVYDVSLTSFKEITQENFPYLRRNKGKKEAYALCPLCENPVKLLGIYARLEKQRPHARHATSDIDGLADFDEITYLRCPNHRQNANYENELRNPEDVTPLNEEILRLAHDQFDRCIYLIKEATGLVVSENLAEELAVDYMAHPGYMTYDANRENIPWIMALCMRGKMLINRIIIEDSPLYKMLKGKDSIFLEPLQGKGKNKLYRIKRKKEYCEMSFNISQYRFRMDSQSTLHEYIKLHIGVPDGMGTYRTFAEKEIEIDPYSFNRLIHSGNEKYRNKKLLDIADRYLNFE